MDQVMKRHCTLDVDSEVKTERKGKTMLPLEGIAYKAIRNARLE